MDGLVGHVIIIENQHFRGSFRLVFRVFVHQEVQTCYFMTSPESDYVLKAIFTLPVKVVFFTVSLFCMKGTKK